MSSGSRDLASDFMNIPSEDEIFSMPVVDAPGDAELGFSDSAGVSPLNAVLQWNDHETGLEAALEAFFSEAANPAQYGMGAHAEAARESALQPEYVQRSPEMWPNAGGLVRQQLAALWRGASKLPYVISYRRSVSHSPHVKRRRAPGRSILDAGPLPALGDRPRTRRSRADIPEVGRSLEYQPVAQTPNSTIIVEGFPTMLRHPFDTSIIPVMYSGNRAHELQAPPIQAHCEAFSAPATYSTAVTVHPVQEEKDLLQSVELDLRYGLSPMSLQDQMECQHMNLDKPRFDQTTVMSSTFVDHANENINILRRSCTSVMGTGLECQLDFHNPSSTTITAHDDPAHETRAVQLAERVPLVRVNHGTALCSDMERLIHISSSSRPSDCPVQDINSWGPIDRTMNPPADHIPERAAPQSELHAVDAKISKKPRLSWTPELISKFEAAIVLLGGPVNATPKSIVRCMACPQVTILHVKSRLQKFRLQTGMEVDPSRRRTKRNRLSRVTHEQSPEDTFETECTLDQVYETCKEWTEELEGRNLHLLHLLAVQHTRSEAAIQHNARVLEEYAARSAASTNPQP